MYNRECITKLHPTKILSYKLSPTKVSPTKYACLNEIKNFERTADRFWAFLVTKRSHTDENGHETIVVCMIFFWLIDRAFSVYFYSIVIMNPKEY